jgi:ParB family chromosome partitioning protein
MLSKDRATVANLLRLLKLPREIQSAVSDGKITAGHARALLAIDDVKAQMALFNAILGQGLSVRDVEARVKSSDAGKKPSTARKTRLKDPEIAALEDELRRIFGTKVHVMNKRGNKGRLVVEYYSLNDFDRILEVVRR